LFSRRGLAAGIFSIPKNAARPRRLNDMNTKTWKNVGVIAAEILLASISVCVIVIMLIPVYPKQLKPVAHWLGFQ
jgi:hypothetical protein